MQPKASLAIFNLLKACFDTTERYPVGNPMVVRIFQNFLTTYKAHLDEEDKLSIELEPSHVRINGRSVPHSVYASESTRWFSEICRERKIQLITFEEGTDIKDLQKFIGILKQPINRFTDTDSASNMLFRQHVQRISINPVNLDATFSNLDSLPIARGHLATNGTFDPEQTFSDIDPDIIPAHQFLAPTSPGYAYADEVAMSLAPTEEVQDFVRQKQESQGQRPAVHLFISNEDYETLLHSMVKFIKDHKLKKVAESLTLMRKDMHSKDYEVRRLAYSSYHVVVQALIREDKLKPISSILKTIAKDFSRCTEPELYRIHLESLLEILQYLRANHHLVRLAYGLDLLAKEALRQTPEIQKMVSQELDRFMDVGVIEELIKAEEAKLARYLKSLFIQHGFGIVNPLLNALFLSEDRAVRRRLLEILMRMGPMIFPLLLKELDRTIQQGEPWFIKRNLLTIMAKSPPVELLPYLEKLLEDKNTRLLDLVYRCIFLINDRAAVEKGKALLKRSSGSLRSKLFQYVKLSEQASYARFVSNLYEPEGDLKDRLEILSLIGSLDSVDTIPFFDRLLSKTKLFESKEESKIRGAVAKALAASKHPQAHTILTKYTRDKNEEVREAAASIGSVESNN
ncbi:HEAT repeat domain-containing protein [Sulfidibacter corallicola]|uniref:HEAT repeat domain-containing protein n=1 Tax=Sulfidibacter corallicola TaxID=2818388 RepID=A0A8A4TXN9_SULCO|nr:HEAT repeat domain-containing protein [Sulfidibacter corallicola]QTD53742.1 HEAT repeat domain-containing protein [Sulfidibacter corallicola]